MLEHMDTFHSLSGNMLLQRSGPHMELCIHGLNYAEIDVSQLCL